MRDKMRKIMVMGLMVLAVAFLAEVAIAADEGAAANDDDKQFSGANEQGYGPGGGRGGMGRGGRFDRGRGGPGMGGPGMGGPGRGERQGGAGNPVRLLLAHPERFELTEDQVAKLEGIEDVEIRPDRELMGELHEEMQAAVIAADVAGVKEVAAKIADLITDTAVAKAEIFAEIKSILTAEQYEQFQDTIKQMQKRRQDRRDMMKERFEDRRGRGRVGEQGAGQDGYERGSGRRQSGRRGSGQQQW